MPTLKEQRDTLVGQLRTRLPANVQGAGAEMPERIADVYLGIDQGNSWTPSSVPGFGDIQTINQNYGGLQGLAKYLVEGGQVTTQNNPEVQLATGGKIGASSVLAPSANPI